MVVPLPQEMRGMYVRDRDGAPVGVVEEVYVDRATGRMRYIGVAADALGVHVLVPLDEVTVHDDEQGPAVAVPYTRAHLMHAPPLPHGAEPTIAQEGEIHSHFDRTPYWDVVRQRQTTPAPTPEVAAAEDADARAGASDTAVHEARRAELAARQTEPAPTTRIADAEVEAALDRGDDPDAVRVKRWGT
jgi:sporulation protein YlmC with PRC-barrel domain